MFFLANENFPKASVLILRQNGHDVLYVSEHFQGADDFRIISLAHEDKRIILTFDRDYGELIFKRKVGIPTGVVYFRLPPTTPEDPAEIIIHLLRMKEIKLEGMFSTIEPQQIRQRPLP